MKPGDPYQPEYDPTRKPPPRGIFLAIVIVLAFWLAVAALGMLLSGFDPRGT